MQSTGAPQPLPPRIGDPLDVVRERLNATEYKITKVRQFLHDLETERTEILQQYHNEIRARAADKARMVVDRDSDRDVLMHDPHSRGPDYNPTTLGPISVQGGEGLPDLRRTKKRELETQEDEYDRHPKRFKSQPSWVEGGSLFVREGIPPPTHGHTDEPLRPQQIIPFKYRPRPPIDLFPFPEYIDHYPAELKHEAQDCIALFNPSPKVKRILDINPVHALEHGSPVQCVKFSPDGKWLATGCNRTAQIYDMETGVKTCVLVHVGDDENMFVYSICFHPDGNYLATGGGDGKIRVWNIAKKRIHNILEGYQREIRSLHFVSNSRFIVSRSVDGSVRIWDLDSRTSQILNPEDHYRVHTEDILTSIAISLDERYIAVGSSNAVVSIVEITTGALVQRLRGHWDSVSCVAFTPDGNGLISGSENKTLNYWDISGLGIWSRGTTGSPCLMNLTGHKEYVNSIIVSPDGNWVVSGCADGKLFFWDARTGVAHCTLSGHMGAVLGVDFSCTGNLLATVGWDGRARIWSYTHNHASPS